MAIADDRLGPLWHAFLATGARRGELAALRWEDLRPEARTITIRRNRVVVSGEPGRRVLEYPPKTRDSVRTIHIDERLSSALRNHRRRQAEERLAAGPAWEGDGHVFVDQSGSPLDPDWISNTWRRVLRATGMRHIRLHDARHGYATMMLEAGVPIEVVSAQLGHARISTTLDLYVRVDESRQRAAADAFGALLDGR